MISRSASIALCVGIALGAATLAWAQPAPIAVYTFDDGTASNVVGNSALDGVPGSSVVFTPGGGLDGTGGAVFNRDGANSKIQVNLDLDVDQSPQLTWGAWVNRTGFDGLLQSILSIDNGGFDRSLYYDTRGGSTGYSAFNGSGVVFGAPAPLDTWTFVAAVYDQSTNQATLYVDGTSTPFATSWAPTGTTSHVFLWIGGNPSFPGEGFFGSIDNVFIFDAALTPEQIADVRTNGPFADGPTPIPTPTAAGAGLLTLSGMALWALRRARGNPQLI
jgi:hypothetical protein